MKTQQTLQIISIKAATDLFTTSRFISPTGNYAGAGAWAVGVLNAKASAGEWAPVVAYGIVLVESGGAIPQGSAVESDANGKAVVQTTGVTLGRALDTASGAGELIRVKL